MKTLYLNWSIILLFLSSILTAQEVTTLANVTANGGLSVTANGDILAAHFGPLPPNPAIGKNIYKITPEGDVSVFVDGELNVGSGNQINSNGFLFQSNFSTGFIYKIDANGSIEDDHFTSVNGPVGIAIDANDTLYISSCSTNTIRKVDPEGNSSIFASGSTFNCTNGITFDDNGNLYTTNFSDGRITKITPDGIADTLGNTSTGNGHITFRSADQNFYIASYSGNKIYKMDIDGNVDLFAGTGISGAVDAINPLEATFAKPNGIALSPDECTLYISQDLGVLRAIHFNDDQCLNPIKEIDSNSDISIYPNPANTFLIVHNESNYQIMEIEIFDSLGRKIMQESEINDRHQINVATLLSGIYMVIFRNELGEKFSSRIIIEK